MWRHARWFLHAHSLRRNRSDKRYPSEDELRQVKRYYIMTEFLYRCPNTGQQVQAWTDDPPVADDPKAFQSVKCIACSRSHWVNPRTGRVLDYRQA